MNPIDIRNLQLQVEDIEQTRRFYRDFLDLNEINFLKEPKIAVFREGNFVLRFQEEPNSAERPKPIDFLGIEQKSFDAVDRAYRTVTNRFPEADITDVREEYKHQQGPYGFYMNDPDGYRLKIYKYNKPDEATESS